MRQLCKYIYASYELTASTMCPGSLVYIHSILLVYEQICLPHAYICSTALLLWSTYKLHITAHKSQKKKQLQLLFSMLLPYMCLHQLCPLNATYMCKLLHLQQWETVPIFMPHMNSVASTRDQEHCTQIMPMTT